ncbi:MAG: hypothetical protein WBZ48_04420 [Bacteroidota bacterium]
MEHNRRLKYFSIFVLFLFAFLSFSCDQSIELNNPFDPNVSLFPPSGLQIMSVTDTSITFEWNSNYKIMGLNQKASSAIAVEQSLDGKTFSFLQNLNAGDTTGTIKTPSDTSLTYYFRVYAKVGDRTTGNSNVVSWRRSSFNPFSLSITNVSEASRILSWHDTSSLVNSFQVERRTGAHGIFNLIGNTPATVTTFVDTTVILTDTTYYYRVSAISKGALLSTYDVASILIVFPPPSNLACGGNSPDSVNLQWTDNFTTTVNTVVERSDDSVNYMVLGTSGVAATKYYDHNVDGGFTEFEILRSSTRRATRIRLEYSTVPLHSNSSGTWHSQHSLSDGRTVHW